MSNAVIPWSGQVLDLTKPADAIVGLSEAAEMTAKLKGFSDACRDTLRAESDRLGQRSFEVDGKRVEVDSQATATEVTYDADKLWEHLREAGLPEQRLGQLITMVPRVDGVILRQLKQNPIYARIIDNCRLSAKEKTRRVTIR